MSRNHQQEAIARHGEIKKLLIRNSNGNRDNNGDDNDDDNVNGNDDNDDYDNDKGKGISKGISKGKEIETGNDSRRDREDSSSSLSSSARLGPSFLHPSSPISNNGEGSSNRQGSFDPAPGGPTSLHPGLSPPVPNRAHARNMCMWPEISP